MSDRQHVESLVREADIYRNQGFLVAAKQKYNELLQFIQRHEKYSKNERLIGAVEKKIRAVEADMAEVSQSVAKPQLPKEAQNLIQKLFSFSKNKETSALEGVVALAKFGQYEKALKEFMKLMNEGILPLEAAKNVLRCQLSLSPPDVALDQYKSWVAQNRFPPNDLNYLGRFLKNLLEKRGVKAEIPELVEPPEEPKTRKKKKEEEEVLDISSVGVPLKWCPLLSQVREVYPDSGDLMDIVDENEAICRLISETPGP